MFTALGRLVAHRARTVLVVTGVVILLSTVLGLQVIPALSSAGYEDPGADSSRVSEYLEERFGTSDPWTILILDSSASADDPRAVAAAADLTQSIKDIKGVQSVESYWSLGRPPQLRSTDGKAAYIFVYMSADGLEERNAASARIAEHVESITLNKTLKVRLSGIGAIMNGVNAQVTSDMKFAETIAIPVSILLTVFVFGSLVASLTPYVVALLAIPGALAVLWGVSHFSDVSVFGLNLVTGLGLGLGIDYALLIVNRFREELARGGEVADAVARTVGSAGRTVVFSGGAVALTLASMALFPQYFLQTFAWAGVSVVLIAVVGAIVPLPALLALLGRRVDAGRVWRRAARVANDGGWWARVARFVMRYPWPVSLAAVALLALLASPIANLQTGQVDDRVLPLTHEVAAAGQVVRDRFEGRESQPLEIVIPGGARKRDALVAYAREVSQVPHVVRVLTHEAVFVDGQAVALNPQGATFRAGDDVRLNAITDVEPRTNAGMDLTTAVRAIPAPTDGTMIGGSAAIYTDAQRGVSDNFPRVALWIALATALVLFLFTGSVLLPIKAVLLNVASLSATFGLLTWIFQEGHLRSLVGDFQLTGSLDTSTLVLIGVVVFGLSMDYELFLLSRIKELHDEGADTETSVALGLQRSGRIITAAALILAAVFIAFVTGQVKSVKLIGVGVAFAILLDATVVRGLLVPALMRIAGRWNWWAPRWLRWLHDRVGLRD